MDKVLNKFPGFIIDDPLGAPCLKNQVNMMEEMFMEKAMIMNLADFRRNVKLNICGREITPMDVSVEVERGIGYIPKAQIRALVETTELDKAIDRAKDAVSNMFHVPESLLENDNKDYMENKTEKD